MSHKQKKKECVSTSLLAFTTSKDSVERNTKQREPPKKST